MISPDTSGKIGVSPFLGLVNQVIMDFRPVPNKFGLTDLNFHFRLLPFLLNKKTAITTVMAVLELVLMQGFVLSVNDCSIQLGSKD